MGINVWQGHLNNTEARIRLRPARGEGQHREDGCYALQRLTADGQRWVDAELQTDLERQLVQAMGHALRRPSALIRHAAGWAADHRDYDHTVAALLQLARRIEDGEVSGEGLPEFAGYVDVVTWAATVGVVIE